MIESLSTARGILISAFWGAILWGFILGFIFGLFPSIDEILGFFRGRRPTETEGRSQSYIQVPGMISASRA